MRNFYPILFALILVQFSIGLKAQVLPADSLALVDIYNAGDGANWTNSANWLTGPVSTWIGVTVSGDRVTELGLNQINFGGDGGTLSPSIGNLTELTKFEIQNAPNLTGPIPPELWNCTQIGRLQIKFTGMTGGIPGGISSMVNMYEINFQQTYLGDTIPRDVFNLPSLEKAYLHESHFTGTVPSTLVNATGLNRLYLQGNKLEGPLPFVNLPAANNAKVQFTGNYFSFTDVKQYHDSAANYALTDDYQFAKATENVIIDFQDDSTLYGEVTGGEAYAWFKGDETIPFSSVDSAIVSADALMKEGIYTCKAQSSTVSNFDIRTVYNVSLNVAGLERDSLALVDIYNAGDGANWSNSENWLTGPVSTWLGVTVDGGRVTILGLNQINFGGNGGTLSSSIGDLTELTKFEIQNAPTLTGSIPSELWNCSKIGRLQIKFTGLTGGIPDGIESMVNAYELNFQQSYLGGAIPEELFNLPSLEKAYLHESHFTGAVPATIANATGLNRLYLQGNKLEGPLPFVNIPASNGAKVQLTGNYFSFNDVKQYHDSAANYALTDDYQLAKAEIDLMVAEGSDYSLGGVVTDAEAYAWFKDAETTPVATTDTFELTGISFDKEGTYICKAQSSLVSSFDIRTIYNLSLDYTGRERDSIALAAIYNAADGANWDVPDTAKWLTGPITKWYGVNFIDGRVAEMGLNQMNFGGNGGTLSPMVGQLTALTKFEIQDAPNLTGSIPEELWNCTGIGRLQLKFTGLTGGIPAGIESMVNAYELNFQQSYLGGEIPEELFNLPSLEKAYLHESNFTGAVPASVANATGLNRLYLQSNKLEGPLPFVNIPASNGAKVQLTGNYFTFDDVKQYHDSAANYALTDDYQLAQDTMHFSPTEGDEVTMNFYAKNGEAYAWFYNEETSPFSSDTSHTITSVARADTGNYVCKVQSSMVSNFDIRAIFVIDDITAIPAISSAASSEDGATVSLTFDYELADPSAEAANFTFKEGDNSIAVSAVSLNNADPKIMVLTLQSAISSNTATLTISYTPGNLQGTTGGKVAAFGPTSVANNLSVGINGKTISETKVYPNPCNDHVQINTAANLKSVSLVDVTGKTVMAEGGLSGHNYTLQLSGLENGVYFISVETENSKIVERVIKK